MQRSPVWILKKKNYNQRSLRRPSFTHRVFFFRNCYFFFIFYDVYNLVQKLHGFLAMWSPITRVANQTFKVAKDELSIWANASVCKATTCRVGEKSGSQPTKCLKLRVVCHLEERTEFALQRFKKQPREGRVLTNSDCATLVGHRNDVRWASQATLLFHTTASGARKMK